jgi:alkaline phosphatase D
VAFAENIIWQVAYDRAFGDIAATGMTSTHRDRDFTVKVDVTGLKSGRRYFYRFVIDGHRSQTGSTKTLPAGDVNRFRLGVASCSNYPQGYFHAYDDMAKSDLDLVLHLGDYIYEYARGRYVNAIAEDTLGRAVEPQNEIVSLDDYRARYALYRSDKDLQAAHAAHPWICVWDDHELMNNTWRGGAENHNEGEGDFDERIAAARTAYHEWMPIRTAAQTDQAPIYRRFQIGQLADLIMLDTRLQGRDEQLDYQRDIAQAGSSEAFVNDLLMNPHRTILGADQENWLASQLADSQDRGAIWQVIGQQVLMGKLITPLIPKETLDALDLADRYRPRLERLEQIARAKLPLNLDAWDGYPACRERIHGLFKQFAPNPVVLAGDTHNAWAFNMQNQQGDEVGVEIGTPGVTSPGMEAYLPAPSQMMREAFKASSTELFDLDTTRRGWTEVEMTPTEVTSKWRFVSTILESQYQINESETLLCKVGDKRFSVRD